MSDTTAELALSLAVDNDDTADYLTVALRNSLNALDGTYNHSTGHNHSGSHQGGTIGANALNDNTIPGAKLVDGSVTAAKLASGMLESLFASTWTTQGTNYVVAAGIMFVFASAAITITLPAAASTNRPITVVGVTGQSTIAAAGGSVIGGSINTSTGAVQNGVLAAGDSLTYKSDGTNWRVV